MLACTNFWAKIVRLLLFASILLIGASAQTAETRPPSRHIGLVLGWDVNCAMRADNKVMTSCGLLFKEANLQILVGIDRAVNYSVTKECGHPHAYWVRSGAIGSDADLSRLLHDVETASEFDGQIMGYTCSKQAVPAVQIFANLITALMLIRPFPPSPENKGIWFK